MAVTMVAETWKRKRKRNYPERICQFCGEKWYNHPFGTNLECIPIELVLENGMTEEYLSAVIHNEAVGWRMKAIAREWRNWVAEGYQVYPI